MKFPVMKFPLLTFPLWHFHFGISTCETSVWRFHLWYSISGISTYGIPTYAISTFEFSLMHFTLWGSVCEFPFLEFPLVKFPLMTFPLWTFPLWGFHLWGFHLWCFRSEVLCGDIIGHIMSMSWGRLWRCSDIQFMSMLGTWCRFANNAVSMFCGAFYVNSLGRIHGNGVGSVFCLCSENPCCRCSRGDFMALFWGLIYVDVLIHRLMFSILMSVEVLCNIMLPFSQRLGPSSD